MNLLRKVVPHNWVDMSLLTPHSREVIRVTGGNLELIMMLVKSKRSDLTHDKSF